MTQEKTIKAYNGYLMLFLFLILFIGSIIAVATTGNPLWGFATLLAIIILFGLILVNPNESRVLLLFGDYKGTVKENGLFWVNPFYTKKKISLRARNFDSERLKVNDKLGNPVMISTILVWRVMDTFKASFDV
ncbi:MAG: SPFH domain-containing protein, partial [Christiangramia sp.]|nr:SPFH domain-containing protein [Christiangramia sp.]